MPKKSANTQAARIPKFILMVAKLLEYLTPRLTTLFAARLFTTPIKHKTPKRELHMLQQCRQQKIYIPSIQKEVNVYFYGESNRKILLVHGWSGRGTQLVKIADAMLEAGFSTISFDAPAHGKSQGRTTLMPEFIASILELEKQFGPFEYAIGHSLGGMSVLNAVKEGLTIKKAVCIGAADIIQDIIDDFISKLKISPKFGTRLKDHFEAKFKLEMDAFSASRAAKKTNIPVFVVHDLNDDEVPVACAYNICKNLSNPTLLVTKNLGHRKILGDKKVITDCLDFLK